MKEEKRAILDLILGIEHEKGRKSTLQLALKQARKLVGKKEEKTISRQTFFERRRNYNDSLGDEYVSAPQDLYEEQIEEIIYDNAEIRSDEEMDVLTALCLYLIALDQLGHIFGKQTNASNRIKDAITRSNTILIHTKQEKEAIANLRNSINHNFGLACYYPDTKKGKMKYVLCIGKDDGKHYPVVLPNSEWDGDWSNKKEETSTQIFPFSLMNFAEEVLASFIELHKSESIESPLGVEELKTRFTILINS